VTAPVNGAQETRVARVVFNLTEVEKLLLLTAFRNQMHTTFNHLVS
jgi:hypothetical protein